MSINKNKKTFLSFQAYQSRDEAQAMIARVLAEKDTLRCQLVELQERVFSLQATGSSRERRQSRDVISHTHKHITCAEVKVKTMQCSFCHRRQMWPGKACGAALKNPTSQLDADFAAWTPSIPCPTVPSLRRCVSTTLYTTITKKNY